MTESEFALSGCFNKNSKFTFKNGEIAYGVIATMFSDEPNNYYLVLSNNLLAFKNALDRKDFTEAKRLSQRINLSEIKKAVLMLDIQTLQCPVCNIKFEYDPNANQRVITSLNESYRPQINQTLEVVAYLTCPNGHTNPYKVKKQY